MYKKIYDKKNKIIGIERGNLMIPICEYNADYKKYLEDIDNGDSVIDEPHTSDQIEECEKKSLIEKEIIAVHDAFTRGFDFDGLHFGMKEHDQRNYESTCNGVLDGSVSKSYVQKEPYGKYEITKKNAAKFKKAYLEFKDSIIIPFEDKVSSIME